MSRFSAEHASWYPISRTLLLFHKRVKPKPTVIHPWIHKTIHSCFTTYSLFFQNYYHPYTKNSSHLIQNSFRSLFKIWLTNYLSTSSCQATPAFSIGPGVGKIHFVCNSIRLWFYSIYSPPTYNLPWRHPVGHLHSVYFWVGSTLSPPIFR